VLWGANLKRLKHSYKINILFAIIITFSIVAVILVNAIVVRLDERFHLRLDLTGGSAFELGDESKNFIASLDRYVEIFILAQSGDFSGNPYLVQAQRIIDQYPRFSNMISLTYIDFAANPLFAASFPEHTLSHGDIIIRSGDAVEQIFSANLFHIGQLPDGSLSVIASRAEEAVTSAILRVISDDNVRIAFLTGNGAADGSLFAQLLSGNSYDVQSASMPTALFDDFDVLLLLSPTIDISEDITRRLDAFLYNDGQYGKTLIYTASAAQGDMPNLSNFLREWGISFHDGMVFETDPERTYSFQPFFPTASYVAERYAQLLRDASMPFLMPFSRPMELLFTSRDGVYAEVLLEFSESSGVQPPNAGESFTASDAVLRGPFPAMVLSSFNTVGAEGEHLSSYVIVSASTGIFDSIALLNTSVTNSQYMLNLLNELSGRTYSVNIEPVSLAGRTLGITSAQASRLGVVLVGIIPLFILLIGIVMWLCRRHK